MAQDEEVVRDACEGMAGGSEVVVVSWEEVKSSSDFETLEKQKGKGKNNKIVID